MRRLGSEPARFFPRLIAHDHPEGGVMELSAVESVDEALEVLSHRGDGCQVLAGGTDVMMQLARGEIAPALLLFHVEGVAELRIVAANGATRIGSLVTHRELARGRLGAGYQAIAESAGTVGGLQTQVVGTIGGNVCNTCGLPTRCPRYWSTMPNSCSAAVRRAGPSRCRSS